MTVIRGGDYHTWRLRSELWLSLISAGASNREIANTLFLAEGTVKNHVTNILGKLGARDRTQAALKAKEMGLA
jgi:DNA-binding NarL/FixJ family response regulator